MVVRVHGWRRFERASQDGSGRFWAIRVEGCDCEIQFGQVGAGEASEERLEHASESEAARTARQKIRTKQLAGWVEVEQVDDARIDALAQGESLEQAIAGDPSNLDNWAVYADWLQAIEPLVGERVALGLALARVGSKAARAQIEARIDELEHTHARELFGVTLAGVLGERKFDDVIRLERQLGMIVGATLSDPENEMIKFDALLSALLDLPLARVLLQLRIATGARPESLAPVAELFVARRHVHLRRLALGKVPMHRAVQATKLPGLAAVLECTPRLERAELYGAFCGDAKHEALRELKLQRPVQAPALDLPGWRMPALQALYLVEPGAVDWHRVELPQLRRLLVECLDFGDRVLASLAGAPLLDHLDSLVLTQSDVSADGIRTILDHAERFAKIRQFGLFEVAADRDDIEQLRRRLPTIVVQQRDRGWYSERRLRDELTRF